MVQKNKPTDTGRFNAKTKNRIDESMPLITIYSKQFAGKQQKTLKYAKLKYNKLRSG